MKYLFKKSLLALTLMLGLTFAPQSASANDSRTISRDNSQIEQLASKDKGWTCTTFVLGDSDWQLILFEDGTYYLFRYTPWGTVKGYTGRIEG